MKKKTALREIKKIKDVNIQIIESNQAMGAKYGFNDDDLKYLKDVETHLLNMNVLFDNMVK